MGGGDRYVIMNDAEDDINILCSLLGKFSRLLSTFLQTNGKLNIFLDK